MIWAFLGHFYSPSPGWHPYIPITLLFTWAGIDPNLRITAMPLVLSPLTSQMDIQTWPCSSTLCPHLLSLQSCRAS